MPTKFYTITEAAAILGLSRVRVWQLIKRDKLAAQRPGHEWIISHQALTAFKRRKRQRGKSWRRRRSDYSGQSSREL